VITDEVRARIVAAVDAGPQELGEPYITWSLSHLRTYLVRTGAVRSISKQRLRQILHEEDRSTMFVGTAEEAMNCACGLDLNDMRAWSELPVHRSAARH
jgi:hypothetical protein